MPHLRSAEGLSMLKRHVSNWMSVLLVYKGMKKSVDARFRDGRVIPVSRTDYDAFYEYLYQRHLSENGFEFKPHDGNTVVTTPDGLQLVIPPMFSLVLDELYLMQIYGRPDLTGQVAVDVGAAAGETALYFAKLGASRVYAFEMDQSRAALASQNVARNGFEDRVTVLAEPATAEKINLLHCGFMKVDCEGCEHELIPKLDLSSTSRLVMEYHGSYEDLVSALEQKGFQVSLDKENIMISAARPATG